MKTWLVGLTAAIVTIPSVTFAASCVDASESTVINATPILKLARQTAAGEPVPTGELAVADSFYKFGKIQLRDAEGAVFETEANIKLTLNRDGLYGYKCELQVPEFKNLFLQRKSYDCVYRVENNCDYVKTEDAEGLYCSGGNPPNIVVGILSQGAQGVEGLREDAKVAAGIKTSEALSSVVKRQFCSSDNDWRLCYPHNNYTMYSDASVGYVGSASDDHGYWIYWDTSKTALHAKTAKYCTDHPAVTTGGYFTRVIERVLGLEFGSL